MHSRRFFGSANFLLGLEPVIEFGARLIATQNVEFVGSSLDSFFKRDCSCWGFFCECECRHEITSGDHTCTRNARPAGGGLDIQVSKRFTIWPFAADYMLTRFNDLVTGNGADQHSLRLSGGITFTFGEGR